MLYFRMNSPVKTDHLRKIIPFSYNYERIRIQAGFEPSLGAPE